MDRDPEGREISQLQDFTDFQDKVVLEIGAGDGRLTQRIAGLSDLTGRTVALDAAPAVLAEAVAAFPVELRPKASFLTAAAEQLPFPSETFDLAILAWSL
jgi:ubiquinone/menaquinone biosynthesis C-methylase UbiE